jgi:hypothetical protein
VKTSVNVYLPFNANIANGPAANRLWSCRIQLSFQGLEWFLYNRTAAYDNIIAQMERTSQTTSRASSHGIFSRFSQQGGCAINSLRLLHWLICLQKVPRPFTLLMLQESPYECQPLLKHRWRGSGNNCHLLIPKICCLLALTSKLEPLSWVIIRRRIY